MPSRPTTSDQPPRVSALVILTHDDDADSLPSIRKTLSAFGGGEVICVGAKGDGESPAVVGQHEGLGELLGRATEKARSKLLLICQYGATVGTGDLKEMLERIETPRPQPAEDSEPPMANVLDHVDIVVGRRPGRRGGGIGRMLRDSAFGIPVADIDSGVVLVRRKLLADIPLHSRSSFAMIELVAKANFMGHVLDEVLFSEDSGGGEPEDKPARRADARAMFREPKFPKRDPTATLKVATPRVVPQPKQSPQTPKRPRGKRKR